MTDLTPERLAEVRAVAERAGWPYREAAHIDNYGHMSVDGNAVLALIAALEAVSEMHRPHPKWRYSYEGGQVCETCSVAAIDHMVEWPCPHIETIESALGVEADEGGQGDA